MNADEQDQLFVAAGQVFQPATPIRTRELFSGRIIQIARVADAVGQSGLHVAVYGERGVGKTSLANILNDIPLHTEMATARVNCDGTDTFTSAWRKLALRLYLTNGNRDTAIPDLIRPDGVVLMLDGLERPAVCIFDEFDRMPRSEARIFSDLIKSLSDNAVSSTVVLVGVAETVTDLVEEHASIERALVQVQMPRMENAELQEILEKAAEQLEVTFSDKATRAIVGLSQGLPHYTHLLGRESVRKAARQGHLSVGLRYVRGGVASAITNAQETIRDQYARAVRSARKDALYSQVLLSCALAEKEERSSFRASDVTKPMSKIMGKRYDIPAIARHLKAFLGAERARVLLRSGKERNYIYRFRNPLMESYVLMRGIAEDKIEADLVSVDPVP